jgi:hypothetical protein
VHASRILITLLAMIVLLAALALEIDRHSRSAARHASHSVVAEGSR